MATIDLTDLANVQEDYAFPALVSILRGKITDRMQNPSMVLKDYALIRKGEQLEMALPNLQQDEQFLLKEIMDEKIQRLLGAGFAIFSDGIINVAMWDVEYPHLLKQTIYTKPVRAEWKQTPLSEVGTFCTGELKIAIHEREAWVRYLKERTETNKANYFGDFIQGVLD